MLARLRAPGGVSDASDDGGVGRGRQRIHLRRFAGPAAFVGTMDPIRVAHLTDQHFGRVTPFDIQCAAVQLANSAEPDIVAITGDFVCHSQAYLDQLEAALRLFDAPVVAVLGNHDHWSGADEVKLALRRAGVLLLSNRHTVVTLRGQRLQIVGLDDAYTGHARRDEAVKGLRRDSPAIGLSHIAEEADGMWHCGVPLVLSGHTHAGQLTFARLNELTLGRIAGHKYVHGLYGARSVKGEGRRSSIPGAVYVGAGIGASVFPLRLGERGQREIALFDLGVPPGSFDEHHGEQPSHKGRRPSERLRAKRAAAVVDKGTRRAGRRRG